MTLTKQLAESKDFTWLPGMVAIDPHGVRWRLHAYNGGWECIQAGHDACGRMGVDCGTLDGYVPDLDDLTTAGVLLFLLDVPSTVTVNDDGKAYWGLLFDGPAPPETTVARMLAAAIIRGAQP